MKEYSEHSFLIRKHCENLLLKSYKDKMLTTCDGMVKNPFKLQYLAVSCSSWSLQQKSPTAFSHSFTGMSYS